MYSYVPEEEPGGGCYAVLTHSLGSLWEDFEHLRNIWTVSNAGLPLTRYLGCNLYFYQSEYTDYAVEIFSCLPMKDYKYTHADIAPNRMLLKKNTIKVPSRNTKKRRKPYKKIKVKPPSQFENKWYFQKDICDIPLVMILATAVDFTYPYGKSNWTSNNISLTCLNPNLFQRNDFQGFSATTGYFPRPNTYLYICRDAQPTATSQWGYLGNTKENQGAKLMSIKDLKTSKVQDWGNIFFHDYLNGEDTIYTSTVPPSQLTETNPQQQFQKLTQPLLITVRYNPEKDKGESNQIYLIANSVSTSWDPPQNPNLIFSGFPLYDLIWGYLDWQEKVHEVQKILENYIVVIRTDTFSEQLTSYIPLDQTFIEGFSAYKDEESKIKITDYDKIHWHPRTKNQLKTLNSLGLTGPACPRPHYDNYLQAQMKYIFRFKWGGCPKTLEKPYDPCSQPTWNIPRNINEGIQIQNPSTAPETEIQQFDWRRDYIKQKTIERIKKYTPIDEPLQFSTESRHNVLPENYQTQETSSETESEEEKESQIPLQEQIQQLRKRQRLLKHRILKRLKM